MAAQDDSDSASFVSAESEAEDQEVIDLESEVKKQNNEDEEKFWDGEDGEDDTPFVPPEGECDLRPEDAQHGVDLFFNNKFDEAERYFERAKDHIPIFAAGYGTISFIKAFMTFLPEDVQNAQQRMHKAEKLATHFAGGDGMLKGMAKKLTFKKTANPTPEQLSNRIIVSEARLVCALLSVLEESIAGFMRAGLGIRKAWKGFEACKVHLEEGKKFVPISVSDRGGIEYGIGSFNLMISILPRKILKMVEVFGFSGDKDVGISELGKCYEGDGLRWAIAALTLLFYHIIFPSFAALPNELGPHIQEADRILAKCRKHYPEGCLFLFMAGRLHRLKGETADSVNCFERSARTQRDWVQLQHLNCYELGWCHMYQLEWAKARDNWLRLKQENEWSKAFFAFMLGVCFQCEGRHIDAAQAFSTVAGLVKKKFGGKVISAEQYALRKVEDLQLTEHDMLGHAGPALLAVELMYLWNGMMVLKAPVLEKLLEIVAAAEQKPMIPGTEADVRATIFLLRGSILRVLNRFDEAESCFAAIQAAEPTIKRELFVIPHAAYDWAVLKMLQGNPAEAAPHLARGMKYKTDYNFEIRLRLRFQAAEAILKSQGLKVKEQKKDKKDKKDKK